METATKQQERSTQQESAVQEPKRLSKLGEWMRDNPGGIGYVKDRRAINRMRY